MKSLIFVITTALATVTLLQAQIPTITNQPANQAVWAGGIVALTVGISGAGPFTYHWQLDATNLANDIITTVAGSGPIYPNNGTYSGDGGSAVSASLNWPEGIAVDSSNNLFIADSFNQRIRKVGVNGTITTVAGSGTPNHVGYSGDGGAATNAAFDYPEDVTVDSAGNLFIADSGNNVIRKVSTNGLISTAVGSGFDAGTGSGAYAGDGGYATNARLYDPQGVAIDTNGNLFIADWLNNVIRKVGTNGIITTVAGNGFDAGTRSGAYAGDGNYATNAELNLPSGVAVDAYGNLFIADENNHRIRKVYTNGIITTVAGNGTGGYSGDGGQATNASLYHPRAVKLDPVGDLIIVDYLNQRIRKVDTNGVITTVASNGSLGFSGDQGAATNASLDYPLGVAVDEADDLFIADGGNYRIRKVTNTQAQTLVLNEVTKGNAGSYQVVVTGPGGSVTSSAADLLVATSPLIYAILSNSDASVSLSFVSPPDSTNVVLGATNLLPPVSWQPLSTNIAGPNGDWQITDTNAGLYQARFYRSVTQ
jgi:sugar lactone lactonase YvrE